MSTIESSDIDSYCNNSLLDPYRNYAVIRELAAVAYLTNIGMYVTGRYEVVKEILSRPDVFISGNGVMMNDTVNNAFKGGIGWCTDGGEHARIRRVEARPLNPRALASCVTRLRSRLTR